jgi:hypothetical protein
MPTSKQQVVSKLLQIRPGKARRNGHKRTDLTSLPPLVFTSSVSRTLHAGQGLGQTGLYLLEGVPVTVCAVATVAWEGSPGVSVFGWVFGLVKEIVSSGACLLACNPG